LVAALVGRPWRVLIVAGVVGVLAWQIWGSGSLNEEGGNADPLSVMERFEQAFFAQDVDEIMEMVAKGAVVEMGGEKWEGELRSFFYRSVGPSRATAPPSWGGLSYEFGPMQVDGDTVTFQLITDTGPQLWVEEVRVVVKESLIQSYSVTFVAALDTEK
jgi:hypothetical protein